MDSGRLTSKEEVTDYFLLATIHLEDEPMLLNKRFGRLAKVKKRFPSQTLTISPSGSVHLSEFPFSESFDVTHRRLAEVAAIFTIKLADAFVSNFEGHSLCIQAIDKHSPTRRLQP